MSALPTHYSLYIGSGGSTLHVLDRLRSDYGNSTLVNRRILVLSAGGHSQRLVSASVLGKLFTALPLTGELTSKVDQRLIWHVM